MKTGTATLMAAIVATASAVVVALYNAKEQRELEREQFQSSLIKESIDFKDYKQSRENLKFLIDVGLISEGNLKINAFIKDTSVHLQRPIDRLPLIVPDTGRRFTVGQFDLNSFLTGTVIDAISKRPIVGAIVIVETEPRNYYGRPQKLSIAEQKLTGRDGKYILPKPREEYRLRVQRAGYVTVQHRSVLFGLDDNQVIELEQQVNKKPWYKPF